MPAPASALAKVVVGTSLGPSRPDLPRHEVLRRAAGSAARTLRSHASVAYALPTRNAEEAVGVLQGAILGAYSFDEYRTAAKHTMTNAVTLVGSETALDAAALSALTDAVQFCRDLVNTPPGNLRPTQFTKRVLAAAAGTGLVLEVLDADRLAADRSGGILGVGQGSSDAPRLIRIAYRHVEIVGERQPVP